MMESKRVVVWFSAGVTSAVAAKIAVDKYRGVLPVHLVNCDTGSEDEDNYRFMEDVARWVDVPLEIIRSKKFANTFEVYRSSGFIKNQYGAKCTTELKKIPRQDYQEPGDLQVFGFDANEEGRAVRFRINNPEVTPWFPLIEKRIDKAEARRILLAQGINEPLTYALGFSNANCLRYGCVKGQMGYWNFVRKVRPEVFWNMAALEREIGHAICKRESRGENGERIGTPVYLDELPVDAGIYNAEPAIQCGLFCGEL